MDPDRPVDAADVVRELKALRRGAAFGGPAPRIGPVLSTACGGGADAVRARIEHLLAGLPEAQRTELAVAFAIDPRVTDEQYVQRVDWLARTHHRDPRTVRRHIDRGLTRIAEAIAGHAAPPAVRAGPWSTQELRVAMALDRRGPEVFELRRVVADRDGLAELDLAVTLGATRSPRDDIHVDVFYGGTLKAVQRESAGRTGYALVLPRPLRRGELHEYAIRTRVAPEAMKPYLVCVPRYPVALFDLRVRFPAVAGRLRVRRLDAVFQRDVDDPGTPGDEVAVDRAGDAHARFADLAPGLAFGLRWDSRH